MTEFKSVQAPLKPYGETIAGYGHANYTQDVDEIYRRQALIAKLSVEKEQIRFDNLTEGYTVNSAAYERLAWVDVKGFSHNIPTPLDRASLALLGKRLAAESPPVIIDKDGDGKADEKYYIVKNIQIFFVPAITLSLALNYFNVSPDAVTVELGKRIVIPHPTIYNPRHGTRVPYSVALGTDTYDSTG